MGTRRDRRSGPLRRTGKLIAWASAKVGLAALRTASLATARRLGENAGAVAFTADRTRRARALDAIGHAFPSLDLAERERIARRSFETIFRTFVEIAWCSRLDPTARAKLIRYEEAHHVESVLSSNRTPIFFTAHAGNWEVIAAAFEARFSRPLVALAKRVHDRRLDELVVLTRRRMGLETVDLRGGLRAASRLLAEKKAVALVVDQAFPRGQVVRSFGRPVALSPGPAVLARRTGSPLVPYSGRATKDGWVVRFGPPIEPKGRTTESLVVEISALLDDLITRHPDEFLWFHRRWRDLPEHKLILADPTTWPKS